MKESASKTSHLPGVKEIQHHLILVLETAEGSHVPDDVWVDTVLGGDDVGLHNLHHGSLQLQLTLASRDDPRMLIDLLQLPIQ